MSAAKENATVVGVGVAACAVCCAGPILGVLAAIGLGTAAGLALFGGIALLIGAVAVLHYDAAHTKGCGRADDCPHIMGIGHLVKGQNKGRGRRALAKIL